MSVGPVHHGGDGNVAIDNHVFLVDGAVVSRDFALPWELTARSDASFCQLSTVVNCQPFPSADPDAGRVRGRIDVETALSTAFVGHAIVSLLLVTSIALPIVA